MVEFQSIFFRVLREEYRDEVKESLQYCNEDIETENDFLNLIFSLTLDGWGDHYDSDKLRINWNHLVESGQELEPREKLLQEVKW